MRLESIRLVNFRNHKSTYLDFSECINIIYGNNGQGKTNILDGIAYSCLTKGFISSSDTSALNLNEDFFDLESRFISDLGVNSKSRICYSLENKNKTFSQNDVKVDKAIYFIGQYPIVVLAPQHYGIVNGLPQERRKFFDIVISQSSKTYLSDLMEFRKVLKHRNKILSDAKTGKRFNLSQIEAWNEPLIKYGSRIIEKRRIFTGEFIPFFIEAYKRVTKANEIPSITYFPAINTKNDPEAGDIVNKFSSELPNILGDEIRRGITLFGPHKDEISFTINDLDVRQYASQGQQKTFIIALKIAEFFYLKEKCAESPVLVLDDVFSELDKERSAFLLKFLQNIGQVFISSTSEDIFNDSLSFESNNKKFYVEAGSVR